MSLAPLLTLCLAISHPTSAGLSGGTFVSTSLAPAAPRRASVEVDTTAVGEEGPALRRRIEGRGRDLLLDQDALPAREPGDPRFRVVVTPARGDSAGFIAAVYAEREGKILGGSTREVDCRLCTEGELVEKVVAALAELIPTVLPAREQPEPEVVAQPPSVAGTSRGASTPPPPGTGPRGKLGALSWAGIGVGAPGLAGVGVGAGVLARGRPVDEHNPENSSDYATAGAAVLVVGAVALVGGVALLVVDQVRQKRVGRHASARSGRLRAVLAGRF